MAKLTESGTRHHLDRASDEPRDWGAPDRTHKYNSGDSVRGNRQRSPSGHEPGGSAGWGRSDGPHRGWDGK